MITVVQRVQSASVRIADECVGVIGPGLLALLGIERGDDEADVSASADKLISLRIFAGRTPMDRSLEETGGACLVVSQFTLAGRVDKGRRPSFDRAESPERAEALYRRFVDELQARGIQVATGRFGANMQVELINDGPVTILLYARGGRVWTPADPQVHPTSA